MSYQVIVPKPVKRQLVLRSPSSYCSTASIGKMCTADPRDIGLACSPGGMHIAYMSDHDGKKSSTLGLSSPIGWIRVHPG